VKSLAARKAVATACEPRRTNKFLVANYKVALPRFTAELITPARLADLYSRANHDAFFFFFGTRIQRIHVCPTWQKGH